MMPLLTILLQIASGQFYCGNSIENEQQRRLSLNNVALAFAPNSEHQLQNEVM